MGKYGRSCSSGTKKDSDVLCVTSVNEGYLGTLYKFHFAIDTILQLTSPVDKTAVHNAQSDCGLHYSLTLYRLLV